MDIDDVITHFYYVKWIEIFI